MEQLRLRKISLLFSLLFFVNAAFGSADIENFRFKANTLSSTNTNGDIIVDPNGTGGFKLPDLGASKVTYINASGYLTSSSTTLNELSMLNGLYGGGNVIATSFNNMTLTSKTIDGDDNTLQDIHLFQLDTYLPDASKFLVRNASGVVVSNTKAVPAGVIVGTTDTQTLTNKTLTAPAITSPTGIVKGDVGLGNVDNTSDATKNSAVATLTNKTLTAPAINDPVTNVQTFTEQASTPATPAAGAKKLYAKTDGKVYTLNSAGVEAQVGSGTGGAGNFIGSPNDIVGWTTFNDAATSTGGADTINNKIDGFAGSLSAFSVGQRVWYSSTGTNIGGLTSGSSYYIQSILSNNSVKLSLTSGGSAIALTTTGSGTVSIRPLLPTDGTGGTGELTIANTATTPLAFGAATSILVTKPASISLGSGFSYNFSIGEGDKPKRIRISASYAITSGSFVAGSDTLNGDLSVWVLDVTNNRLIQPDNFKFYSNSSSPDFFSGTFQPSSDSTSYRLILFENSTNTAAYTFKLGNVTVWPGVGPSGTPVTDWATYTPTINGVGTAANITSWWRRVGDQVEIQSFFQVGTNTATTFSHSLPAGLTIDSNKLNGIINNVVGQIVPVNTATPFHVLAAPGGTTVTAAFPSATTNQSLTSQNGSTLFANGIYVSMKASVPVTGWSSSTRMSDGFDGRIINAVAGLSGTQSIPNSAFTKVNYNLIGSDKTNSFNTSTGEYTVPSFGDYNVNIFVEWAANATGTRQVFLKASGGQGAYVALMPGNASTNYQSGSYLFTNLQAGEKITAEVFQSSGGALNIGGSGLSANYLVIKKEQGPQTIAQSPSIEYKSVIISGVSPPATGTLGDLTYIDVPAGSFDCSGGVYFTRGSGSNFTNLSAGIGLLSGTGSSDLFAGQNYFTIAGPSMDTAGLAIPPFRVTVYATTRVYLKMNSAYTLTNSTVYGSVRCIPKN